MSDAPTSTQPQVQPGFDPATGTIGVPANTGFQIGAGDGLPPTGPGSGQYPGIPPQQQQQQPPPPAGPPAQGVPQPRFFTEEDVARIRQEEKAKLYPQLEDYKTRAERLEREAAERAEREAQEQAQREEAERKAREADMDAKTLLEERDREWKARFDQMEQERARERAMYEQERRFQELQAYKARVLAANVENILPEFADPEDVHGDTEEAINASVQRLIEKSAKVMQNFQSVADEGRRMAPGIPPTAPAVGPMEMGASTRRFSAEELAAMPMSEYAKIRQYLPTGQSDGRGDRGMFG